MGATVKATNTRGSTSAIWAVALAARLHGLAADASALADELGLDPATAEVPEIERCAASLGLAATVSVDRSEAWLRAVPRPVILRLRDGSFAVLRRVAGGDAVILPGEGRARPLGAEELARTWSGEAVLVRKRAPYAAAEETVAADADAARNWFGAALWRHRGALAQVLVATGFTQLFMLATPLFFQVLIDKVLVHRSSATLNLVTLCLVAIGVFDAVLQHLKTCGLANAGTSIDLELGANLFGRLVRLPLGYFERHPMGQTVARLREIETIRSFMTGHGLSALIDAVFALVFAGVLFAYSWRLGLVAVATLPFYVLVSALISPALRRRIRERFERNAASQSYMVESVAGIATIKASGVEGPVANEWNARLGRYVESALRAITTASIGQNAITLLTRLGQAAIIFAGAREVMAGRMTVGALVAFNMIANQLVAPILRLSGLWQDMQQVRISSERIGDILREPPEAASDSGFKPDRIEGAISFRGVSFSYPTSPRPVLCRLSLDIAAGEMIGVVGHSGSGKSTLARLLQMLDLPTEGEVLVDGIPTSDLSPAALRRQIGVVLQENVLFNRSVRENIAFGRRALSDAGVRRCAMLAGADDFIRRMPRGYDTVIEERGSNLSGGQRQRIAIARALARDPRILILDEATSALDYESELVVQANMRLIARGRTVILIAHRLASLRGCDRIVALDGGAVAESGPHAELVNNEGGLYRRLWSLQQGGLAA